MTIMSICLSVAVAEYLSAKSAAQCVINTFLKKAFALYEYSTPAGWCGRPELERYDPIKENVLISYLNALEGIDLLSEKEKLHEKALAIASEGMPLSPEEQEKELNTSIKKIDADSRESIDHYLRLKATARAVIEANEAIEHLRSPFFVPQLKISSHSSKIKTIAEDILKTDPIKTLLPGSPTHDWGSTSENYRMLLESEKRFSPETTEDYDGKEHKDHLYAQKVLKEIYGLMKEKFNLVPKSVKNNTYWPWNQRPERK